METLDSTAALQTPGERIDCISDAQSTGHPCRKQCKISPTHTSQRISASCNKDSNRQDAIFKLVEENSVFLWTEAIFCGGSSTHSMWKFPGQGLNPCMPQPQSKLLQWQCQILNLLCTRELPHWSFKCTSDGLYHKGCVCVCEPTCTCTCLGVYHVLFTLCIYKMYIPF